MDSDDDEDDFFISRTADEDDVYFQESVYIESKSPTRKLEPSTTGHNATIKLESEHHRKAGQTRTDTQSNSESETQQIGTPEPVEKKKVPKRLTGRRKQEAEEDDYSDAESDTSFKSRRSQSPTPRAKRVKSYSAVASFLEPDENEEFFNEIAKETNGRLQTKETILDQPKRIYNVRFLSKLDGTINKTVQVKVLGRYELSLILPSILEKLFKQFELPPGMIEVYKPENVSLYWNNAKLLKFMSCNSLRVPQTFENEVSDISILMVSKEFEKNFEENIRLKLLQEEAAVAAESLSKKETYEISTQEDNDHSNHDIEQFEKELKNAKEINSMRPISNQGAEVEYINLDSEDDEELIKISLVGQDNKKLYVNVRKSTPISKLADYYREHKDLPNAANVKLLFDHDELDQRATVGEQDMEDEDMIEVVTC